MAYNNFNHQFIAIAVATLVLNVQPALSSCYTSIFQFGDSLADTGNAIRSNEHVAGYSGRLPFGQTYFNEATGRFSDGRLLIDFIAQGLGLPLLRPYLAGGSGEEFKHGANFAVASATALDLEFFTKKGLQAHWTRHNLADQIEWFKKLIALVSSDLGVNETLSKSLIMMGEIGGNDYNHAFFQKKSVDEIKTFVPEVIKVIGSAISDLINLGAKTFVVPGNFPIGCVPIYLVIFQTDKADNYDSLGCIKWLNELSIYHNQLLQEELERLQRHHPHANIIYGNYYEATLNIFHAPELFGLKEPMRACCGGDGTYGMAWNAPCGSPASKVCSDPSTYFSWDGLHPTEAAYKNIARSLLDGPHAVPPLIHTCGHPQSRAYD